MASYYLQLLQSSLSFPPVSREINVFFDECRKHVFAVSNKDGLTRVQVIGYVDNYDAKFELQDKGRVISIKFSPNKQILAVQRSPKVIDFLNFVDGTKFEEYSQSCKGRTTEIIGFCWTGETDIVFVTNQGLEFYTVAAEKSCLKSLKTYHIPVNWYVFLPDIFVLVVCSGAMGNDIHPYTFKSGSITRLPKFSVENPPSTRNPQPATLLERDVVVANIYNKIYVVLLRNHPRLLNAYGAEIVLYLLQKDAPAKKTAVLRLGAVGRFAVNIVDNLIAVHHQASKTSMIFDIKVQGEFDGQVTNYYPVLSPLPIAPIKIQSDCGSKTCEYYSPNWVVFQPNIIIDAKLGCLWKLHVRLDSLVNMMEDKGKLVDFLLLRSNSKPVVISVLQQILTPGRQCSLGIIAQIFDKINALYAEYIELNNNRAIADSSKENELAGFWFQRESVIDQQDIFVGVLQPFVLKETKTKTVVAVLMEYIRSLNSFKIPVEYYIYEFVISILLAKGLVYQLHQFIQYHVLSDSKLLALLLLSLNSSCANHLALDMLKRLGKCQTEIVDVLLSHGNVVSALKYLQQCDAVDSAAPRKFLQAAVKTGDDLTFHSVFTFMQQRNMRLRKSVDFVRAEQCSTYQALFDEKFGKTANGNAANLSNTAVSPNILEKLNDLQI